MSALSQQILKHAIQLPEGAPLTAKALLHLGTRAAVGQALHRLASRGALMRASRGLYVRPVKGRFGARAPATTKLIAEIAAQRGETIAQHGAAAANALGLTKQVPMRMVYLTSGTSRKLKLGAQTVEFRHAPSWLLIHPQRIAGDVIRALAWMGPERAKHAVSALSAKLQPAEMAEVVATRSRLPAWMAGQVSSLIPRD